MSAWACFYNCYTTESCYTTGDAVPGGASALVSTADAAARRRAAAPRTPERVDGAGWETASGVLISGVGKISPHANECLTQITQHTVE